MTDPTPSKPPFDPSRLTIAAPAWEAMVRYVDQGQERTRRHLVRRMISHASIKQKTCETLISEAIKLGILQVVFKPQRGQCWYAAGENHPTHPQALYRR